MWQCKTNQCFIIRGLKRKVLSRTKFPFSISVIKKCSCFGSAANRHVFFLFLSEVPVLFLNSVSSMIRVSVGGAGGIKICLCSDKPFDMHVGYLGMFHSKCSLTQLL